MATAMTDLQSLLEQRIWNEVRKTTKHADATAAALARRGIAFAIGAAEIRAATTGGSVQAVRASRRSAARAGVQSRPGNRQ
jgi:hypothetical protein